MRLISQDGMIDVPYEQVAIELKESEVWCEYSATVQSYCTGRMMAKYTTESKAIKVMEMLQKQFLDYCCNYHSQSGVFCFPKDEEVEV